MAGTSISTGWYTQVDGATVSAGSTTSVQSSPNEKGHRYALVTVTCNQAHDINFYGAEGAFTSISNAWKLTDESRLGVAAVSGYAANAYYVYIGGIPHFAVTVKNNGSSDATVTVRVRFFDP